MFSHQRVRQKLKAITLRLGGQRFQVYGKISWCEEYILTPSTTFGDVMKQ